MSVTVPFAKMVGTGNDFLIVDARRRLAPSLARRWAPLARAACHRQYGLGADGLLVIESSKTAAARMRIFNSDGSEAEMCGNGARCAAWFVARGGRAGGRRVATRRTTLQTQAGLLSAAVTGDRVRIQLTNPTDLRRDVTVSVDGRTIRLGVVNTGVPHAVVPVPAVDAVDVPALGRQVRFHPTFAPRGTNVNFIQAQGPGRLRIRTYERGVEGETLACGTGVTAAAVIHALSQPRNGGGPRRVQVTTRSGETLTVELAIAGHGDAPVVGPVFLEGAVRWIGEGTFVWEPTTRAPRTPSGVAGAAQAGA
jgi:diaminopimelate epimerase